MLLKILNTKQQLILRRNQSLNEENETVHEFGSASVFDACARTC